MPVKGPLRWPALAALCAVSAVAGLVLAVGPGARPLTALLHDNVLNNVVNGVALGVLAGVLTRLRPENRVGRLLLVIAGCNAVCVLGEGWALASYRLDLPLRDFAIWLGSWPWAPALLLGPTLLPLLYPSGHTTSRLAHRLAIVGVAAAGTVAVALALLNDAYASVVPGHPAGANPLSQGHLQAELGAVALIAAVISIMVGLTAWGHTLRRLSHAQTPEREQLAWLLVMVVPLFLAAPLNAPWLNFTLEVLSPVGLLIGIVRYQLFDIKLVLRSGLVYGGLLGVAIGGYFGTVALITVITPPGTAPRLFAAAVVGLIVVPTHRWLHLAASRLVYGDRRDPIRALQRVADGIRLGDEQDPTGVRPMLSGIADAMRSPYAAVTVADGTLLAAVGEADGHPLLDVPLAYAGEHVGTLSVAGRTTRDALGPADRKLLDALAGPVAAAVRAGVMARELGASRARVLAVREAERRLLRDDLHDGVGPSLSGVALGLEAARTSVASHPQRVPEILEIVHREVDSLVLEVRRIIDDLGPGDVDLSAALRGQVEALAAASRVAVQLDLTGLLVQLPSQVAVAAQRIAAEALSNAVRHAGASRILLTVASKSDQLTVEVADDGNGAVAPRTGGVGLSSMRQRAEAVGGRLALHAVPGGGTRVLATLPLGTG